MKSAGGVLLIAGAVVLLWLGWSGKYQQVWEAVTSPLDGSDPPDDETDEPGSSPGPDDDKGSAVDPDDASSCKSDEAKFRRNANRRWVCVKRANLTPMRGGQCPAGYEPGFSGSSVMCAKVSGGNGVPPTGKCSGPRPVPAGDLVIPANGPNACCEGEISLRNGAKYGCSHGEALVRARQRGWRDVVTGGGEAWTERPTGVVGLRKTAKGR